MIGYRSKLAKDLERWRERGILDAETFRAIESDVAARGKGIGIPAVLAILGAVLLCFAAMTFVAANWQELSKLTRLSILFGSLWGAYGAAWLLQRARMPYGAEAAILLGSGLFGANIMLIAQIYHIDGNPPDAVFVWACGVLLGGILLQSRPALALAVILFSLWSGWEVTQLGGRVHFPYLLAWAACAIPIFWLRWKAGYQLLAVALSIWIVGLGYLFEQGDVFGTRSANPVVVGIGLLVMAGAIAARDTFDRWTDGFGGQIPIYGLAITFAGLFGLQFIDRTPLLWLVLLALATLALVLGALYYGVQSDNRGLTRAAYALFSIELLGLYFKTLGTLLDTALFFLIAGVIVIALALLARWLNTKTTAGKGAPA